MAVGVLTRAIGIVQAGQRVRALEFPPAVVASVILAFGMALLGAWVSNRAEEGVLQREASETVLAMDSFIKPLVQDLAQGPVLPEAALDALSAMVRKRRLERMLRPSRYGCPMVRSRTATDRSRSGGLIRCSTICVGRSMDRLSPSSMI